MAELDLKAREELYKFVRDRYDKLILARSMAQTRLGHLLVMSGFLVTSLTSVGLPQLVSILTSCDINIKWRLGVSLVFMVALICLATLISYLIRALCVYVFAVPMATERTVMDSMKHPDLAAEVVYTQLTQLYLLTIEATVKEGARVGNLLRKAFIALAFTLCAVGGLVGLLILVYLVQFK